jgi:hypothetical protein
LRKILWEVCIPLLFLGLGVRVFAQGGPLPPPPPLVNIDLGVVVDSVNSMFSGLSQSLSDMPAAVVNLFFSVLQSFVADFLSSLLFVAKMFIVSNPDISPMLPLWQTIVYIISLFYLILFMVVGFLFLFSSIDAEKRLTAKQWFKNTIIMIVCVAASFYLYDLVLRIGAAIAGFLWSSEFEALFQASQLSELNIVLLAVYSIAVLGAFITFMIRYLFLFAGAAIVPIALFFYFIPPLKPWGKMLLEILFAAILMQIIDVIIFIACQTVWQQFAGVPDSAGWAPLTAFALIAFTNMAIIAFALMKAARTITKQLPELAIIAKTASSAAIGAMV